jgi:hypothetical protein
MRSLLRKREFCMIKKMFNAIRIYRSFWQRICDKLCHYLGGIGAYLFMLLVLVFHIALILFFSLAHYLLSSTNGEITNTAKVMGSAPLALTIDIFYRAAFYMIERMRNFIDRF